MAPDRWRRQQGSLMPVCCVAFLACSALYFSFQTTSLRTEVPLNARRDLDWSSAGKYSADSIAPPSPCAQAAPCICPLASSSTCPISRELPFPNPTKFACPSCDCSASNANGGSAAAVISASGWDYLESNGYHCMSLSFESPIPQFSALRDSSLLGLEAIFRRDAEMPGINWRVREQLAFLEGPCRQYKAEYDSFPERQVRPDEYGVNPNGGSYAPMDAAVMHCIVRHHKPKRVIEVGSGSTSLVMTAALVANAKEGVPSELTCIDPHPDAARVSGLEALQQSNLPVKFKWERTIVQKVDHNLFTSLQPGDILFIDSSHVARVGHDVNFLYLEILPKVPVGVLVHVHDIFFPREYPQFWVMDLKRFLNEQYLLQMFLTGNKDWDVLYTGFLLADKFPARMRKLFRWYGAVPHITGNPSQVDWQAAAFWMVRKGKGDDFASLAVQLRDMTDA